MANFSDDFTTDPSGRWNYSLWTGQAMTWNEASHWLQCPTNGAYAAYATSTGSATQYLRVKLTQVTNARGGAVLRSTNTGSDGFYFVVHFNGNVVFGRANNTGWLADMTSTALSFAENDVMGVTISGTGTGTTAKIWKNPTNNTPVDADNWDSGSDPSDASLTASGGTYYDTGQYVGVGIDATGASFDDVYGGSLAGGTTLQPGAGAIVGTGLAPLLAFALYPSVGTLALSGVAASAFRTQYGRPSVDITDGNWTPSTGVDLYATIDELVVDDADYDRSGATPVADTAVVGLSSLITPGAGIVTMRVRAKKI